MSIGYDTIPLSFRRLFRPLPPLYFRLVAWGAGIAATIVIVIRKGSTEGVAGTQKIGRRAIRLDGHARLERWEAY